MYSSAVPLTIQCIAALVEIFAEEGLFCFAFMCRNAGRKSNDLDFRRLVLVWSLKLLQAFGGFTCSSLAIYNPKIRNLFSIPSMYDQNLWDFPNVPTYRTSKRSGNLIRYNDSWQLKQIWKLYIYFPVFLIQPHQ